MHADISSVGYVTFNRSQNDFMITWHTPYADEPNEQIDIEDKNLLLFHMHQTYGSDETTKSRMANEFDIQQRNNEKIKNNFLKAVDHKIYYCTRKRSGTDSPSRDKRTTPQS